MRRPGRTMRPNAWDVSARLKAALDFFYSVRRNTKNLQGGPPESIYSIVFSLSMNESKFPSLRIMERLMEERSAWQASSSEYLLSWVTIIYKVGYLTRSTSERIKMSNYARLLVCLPPIESVRYFFLRSYSKTFPAVKCRGAAHWNERCGIDVPSGTEQG